MTRTQEIRHEVLTQLYGAGSIAISTEHIKRVCRHEDFDYTEGEIREALFFLKGQGMSEEVPDRTTGIIRHRITSAGMLQHENQ